MLLAGSVVGKWGGSEEGGRQDRGLGEGRETGRVEAWSAAGNEVFSFHPQKAECEWTGLGSAWLHRFLSL